ncbi:MAG: L,D-transpeptidase [Lachnospiraceae bacterium]|nr:L,D-transpeptidase [Lachnospiraceae bacterium]
MLKKAVKITIIILIGIIIVIGAGYGVICGFYSGVFLCGTYVNGRDISGMTVEQASGYLTDTYGEGMDLSDLSLTFQGRDGYSESIDPENIGLKADMNAYLEELKNSQKPYEWPVYFMYPTGYRSSPLLTFDEDMLKSAIRGLNCVKEAKKDKTDLIEIRREGNGFTLFNNIEDTPDEEAIYDRAVEILGKTAVRDIVIDFTDCYIPHEIPEKFNDTLSLYDKISRVASSKIKYSDSPLSYELDGSKCLSWLVTGNDGLPILDENGELVFDETKVEQCTEKLAEVFDTSGGVINWKKQNGEIVTLNNQMQGYSVDQENEALRIKESLLRGGVMERSPIYSQMGPGRGRDVVGKTYIEVDMGSQKLYYYVDGALKLKTDVVTGNIRRGNGTPEKLCYVYFKQKNRTLHGANYATFVYYWMAVTGHIGIHDATWRSKFGGEIYKTDGSHGCINIPKNMAAQLYDIVEVGTPCVLYY